MGVLLVANTSKPHALEAAEYLVREVARHGIDVWALDQDVAAFSDDLGVSGIDVAAGLPPDLDLVVALGGDGTILRAVHTADGAQIPILGVKLGRLGFLSGASREHALEAVLAALSEDARVDVRATVRVRLGLDDGSQRELFGLNEIVIARGASGRVIGFTVAVDGEPVASMRGDGVLVATATGSTGYALSAGGPVVAPGFRGLVVVPIAPHTLNARALVTGEEEVVRLDFSDDQRGEAVAFVDGEPVDLGGAHVLTVEVDSHGPLVHLVRYDEDPFYRSVSNTFFGGA